MDNYHITKTDNGWALKKHGAPSTITAHSLPEQARYWSCVDSVSVLIRGIVRRRTRIVDLINP